MNREIEKTVRVRELSRLVYEKRKADGLTLEMVAEKTKISPATLSRVERQRLSDEVVFEPSTKTITALTQWLRIPVETVLDVTPQPDVADLRVEDHLVAVQAHLRAKRNLDSESMGLLGEIFQLAFQQYGNSSSQSNEGDAAT